MHFEMIVFTNRGSLKFAGLKFAGLMFTVFYTKVILQSHRKPYKKSIDKFVPLRANI